MSEPSSALQTIHAVRDHEDDDCDGELGDGVRDRDQDVERRLDEERVEMLGPHAGIGETAEDEAQPLVADEQDQQESAGAQQAVGEADRPVPLNERAAADLEALRRDVRELQGPKRDPTAEAEKQPHDDHVDHGCDGRVDRGAQHERRAGQG